MPAFDQTGPYGMGPGTGMRRGPCLGDYTMPLGVPWWAWGVMIVGGYGFVIWMSQLILGPPGGH